MDHLEKQEQLHTDEIQAIISRPPKWIYKWGVTTFIGIMVICFTFAAFIKIPEIARFGITIHNFNSEVNIPSVVSGELTNLLVENDQMVKKGKCLAIISDGKNSFPIFSPVNGRVKYIGILHNNLLIKPGQLLFEIERMPLKYYGQMAISENTYYHFKPGQKLQLKIDDYPFEKFGFIEGDIKYLSIDTAKKSHFLAEININDSKNSRNNSRIILADGMTASTDIVMSETSLLKKMFDNISGRIKP